MTFGSGGSLSRLRTKDVIRLGKIELGQPFFLTQKRF